jgi:hypothetical protein
MVQRLSWLGMALFTSRILAELGALSPISAAPIALGLTGLALGIALGMELAEHSSEMWPGLLLWVYVLYPHFDPRLSAAIGLWAVGIWLMIGSSRLLAGWRLDIGLFLAALGLYVATLSPGLLPADAGELQLAAARLDVAHPPGFPLYTMVGWLFTRLTPSNPAYGLNLFSALTMAASVAMVGRAARRVTGEAWAGIAAAVAFAVAASVWVTGTQASIRPLMALFTALVLDALLAFYKSRQQGALVYLGASLGAGIAHHPSLTFLAPIAAASLLAFEPGLLRTPRRWVAPLAAALAGFLPWAYLPLRSAMGAPSAPPSLATWPGFWDYVLTRGFAGDFFYFHTAQALADRMVVLGQILLFQWNGVLLALGALAAVVLVWRDWRVLLALGGSFAVIAFVTMTYRAPQTVEYLIPAYVALAIMLGTGLGWLCERRLRAAALSAALIAGLAVGERNLPTLAALARDDSTRAYAEAVFQQAPEEAVVLANWHWATPLQAYQAFENIRPDVEIIYVYPEGAEPLAETWAHRITAEIEERPVIVTGYYPDTYAALPFTFEPLATVPIWRVREAPRQDLPAGMTPQDFYFDPGLALAGTGLDRAELPAGETMSLRLAWQVTGETTPGVVGFVHLVDAEGHVMSGDDRSLPTSLASAGDMLVMRYRLGAPLTLTPGTYDLVAGLYTVGSNGTLTALTADGQERVVVGTITVTAPAFPAPTAHPTAIYFDGGWQLQGYDWDTTLDAPRLMLHWRERGNEVTVTSDGEPVGTLAAPASLQWAPDSPSPAIGLLAADGAPLHRLGPWGVRLGTSISLQAPEEGERYVPLGGAMVLSHVELHPVEGLRAGDDVRVDVTFLSARPLLEDDVVKVDIIGEGWAWRAQSDHIPATGALPTLKWLWGSRVTDRHRLTVPSDAPTTGAWAELVVYDHFTGERLLILDPDVAEQGIAVPLGSWPTIGVAPP